MFQRAQHAAAYGIEVRQGTAGASCGGALFAVYQKVKSPGSKDPSYMNLTPRTCSSPP